MKNELISVLSSEVIADFTKPVTHSYADTIAPFTIKEGVEYELRTIQVLQEKSPEVSVKS